MKTCIFCEPAKFGDRKLFLEDKYWYLIVPKEIGPLGQVALVVKKLPEDTRHITDVTDVLLSQNNERLTSVMKGIHLVSAKLKKSFQDEKGRSVEKVYVLSQCEGEDSHIHFQFYPRYKGDLMHNEFLYDCELNEARWQDPPTVSSRNSPFSLAGNTVAIIII